MATGKAGELVSFAREILRAIGNPARHPTFVGTDNLANGLLASGRAIPARSKHCLRRYLTFLQRVAAGEAVVGHVPDPANPTDWFTKWVPAAKAEMSLNYATNRLNRVVK